VVVLAPADADVNCQVVAWCAVNRGVHHQHLQRAATTDR
jgi:hypothetical protein